MTANQTPMNLAIAFFIFAGPPCYFVMMATFFLPEKDMNRLIFLFTLGMCVMYTLGLLPSLKILHQFDFGSLSGVQKVFHMASLDPYLGISGWLHFIVYDLIISWICILDNLAHPQMPNFCIACILPMLIMFGPTGFLMYNLARVYYTGGTIFEKISQAFYS